MRVIETELPGVILVEPRVFRDRRGFLLESFNLARYREHGIWCDYVQQNHTYSVGGTIRGLHYQLRSPQGKLIRTIRGSIYDVAVDVRRGSPTFGKWTAHTLTDQDQRQLFIPPGFAHGFCVTSPDADVEYRCSDYYDAEDQHGVLWCDPALAIPWPVAEPILSDRDQEYRPLSLDRDDLPSFASDDP